MSITQSKEERLRIHMFHKSPTMLLRGFRLNLPHLLLGQIRNDRQLLLHPPVLSRGSHDDRTDLRDPFQKNLRWLD